MHFEKENFELNFPGKKGKEIRLHFANQNQGSERVNMNRYTILLSCQIKDPKSTVISTKI